jgi:predicted esterase
MRLTCIALVVAAFAKALHADPTQVTVIAREARHTGALSIAEIEIKTNAKMPAKVPLSDIASIQFADAADLIRTRQGKRLKGTIRVDDWTLKEKDADPKPLSRADLRFIIPQILLPTPTPRKALIIDATTANGMTWHVRLPEKYDPKLGAPAIILFHGSNACSADYLIGITQRWPKLAADYVLIGIDGEWPNPIASDAAQPTYNYTYVNFVGKSKYKGYPGSDRESPALVAEAVAEIRQQIKLTKIFITGHSQGGFLVYSLLMNYPDLFAGGMPISAGLIFQCEPTAYENAEIRQQQRKRPLVILHGDADPLVSVSMARSAYDSFLYDGFPMLRLAIVKGAGHAFIALPFEEGIRWMESMTADDPKALLTSAERAYARHDYRDATAYLLRARELDTAGAQTAAIQALQQKVEQLAAAPARKLETTIRDSQSNAWVADFDAFRRQFEFTEAAAPVLAEYAKLHKTHEKPAEKLWGEVRKAFQEGNKDQGYKLCEELAARYYASSYYRYAKQTLEERK